MLPSRVPVVVVGQTPRCHPRKLPTLATSRSITKPCRLCVPACPAVLARLRLPGRPVSPSLLRLEAGPLRWSSGAPCSPRCLSHAHTLRPLKEQAGPFLSLSGHGPQRHPLPPAISPLHVHRPPVCPRAAGRGPSPRREHRSGCGLYLEGPSRPPSTYLITDHLSVMLSSPTYSPEDPNQEVVTYLPGP